MSYSEGWDACAAEAVRCGLLSTEEGRILANRKSMEAMEGE